MKTRSLIPVFLLSALLAATSAAGESAPYRVGVILPLSGTNALGVGIRQGCQLAEEKIVRTPSFARKLAVTYEDDQYNPAKTVSALHKLIAVDDVGAVVTLSSGPARASVPIVERRQIPMIAIATNDGFTKDTRFSYSLWMTPAVEAGAMLKEARRRGYRRIARVSAQNPVMEELKRVFDVLNRGEIEIALDEELAPDSKDFGGILPRLRRLKNIDGIMLNLLPEPVGLFAAQARSVGLTQDLFSAETFEAPDAIKLARGALEGQWYVSSAEPSADFAREFKQRFPDSMLVGAANCYDALMMLAEGLKRGNSPVEVNAYLRSINDYQGALGRYSMGANGTFLLPAGVRVVVGMGYKELRPGESPGSPL